MAFVVCCYADAMFPQSASVARCSSAGLLFNPWPLAPGFTARPKHSQRLLVPRPAYDSASECEIVLDYERMFCYTEHIPEALCELT